MEKTYCVEKVDTEKKNAKQPFTLFADYTRQRNPCKTNYIEKQSRLEDSKETTWISRLKTALLLMPVVFLIDIAVYSFIADFIGASIAFFISFIVGGVIASGGQTRYSQSQGMPILGATVGGICFLILTSWSVPGINGWILILGLCSIIAIILIIVFKLGVF